MPRLPYSLLLRAYNISPLLPLVLRGTRCLDSAINELRWLREHIQESSSKTRRSPSQEYKKLLNLCRRRERGEPLQYILGSQPFGELDIKCRPGVLIPRPETEAYTEHLSHLLLENALHPSLSFSQHGESEYPLRIVDLCSGAGCISLLAHSLLGPKFPNLQTRGWDLSPLAVSLARYNLKVNTQLGHFNHVPTSTPTQSENPRSAPRIKFEEVDIFATLTSKQKEELKCDILISNPPYISPRSFDQETTRSVRNWEPKLALVPPPNLNLPHSIPSRGVRQEDIFYERILELNRDVCKSRVCVMEVGDGPQALRVVEMALEGGEGGRVEIWRDWPDVDPVDGQESEVEKKVVVNGRRAVVRGAGKMRAIVVFS